MKGVYILAPGHLFSVDEEKLIERFGGWFHGKKLLSLYILLKSSSDVITEVI